MLNVLTVFVGGGLGALLRWSISLGLAHVTSKIWVATFAANIIGCTGLFIVGRWLTTETSQLFVRVAFFGGLTTFSSFTYEVVSLFRAGQVIEPIGVVLLNVLCGIFVGVLVLR